MAAQQFMVVADWIVYSELPWFQASSKGWMLHTKKTLAVWYMFHKVIWCVTFQRSLDDLSFKIHLVEFITLKSALALGSVREFLSLKQNFSIQSPVHKCGIVSKASVVSTYIVHLHQPETSYTHSCKICLFNITYHWQLIKRYLS